MQFSLVNPITQQILVTLGPNLYHGCISGLSWLSSKVDDLDLFFEVMGLISTLKFAIFACRHDNSTIPQLDQSLLAVAERSCGVCAGNQAFQHGFYLRGCRARWRCLCRYGRKQAYQHRFEVRGCSRQIHIANQHRARTKFTALLPYHKLPQIWNMLMPSHCSIINKNKFKNEVNIYLLSLYSDNIQCQNLRCRQCFSS